MSFVYHSVLLSCRLYGLISLGRNASPMAAPRKTHTLIVDGMYSEWNACAIPKTLTESSARVVPCGLAGAGLQESAS